MEPRPSTRDPAPSRSSAPRRSREHWIALALSLACVPMALAFALWLDPDPRGFGTHEQLGLRPCLPMAKWNVPCPGCGVTTSIVLAWHGQVLDSLVTQPFGSLLAGLLLAVPIAALALHLCGRDLWGELQRLDPARWVGGFATLALLAWAYKIWRVRG